MSNKPSWDDAPEFAKYLTQDSRGVWKWWESEPYPSTETDSWLGGGESKQAMPCIKNWERSKQTRPKVTAGEARQRIIEITQELRNLKKVYKLDNFDKKLMDDNS